MWWSITGVLLLGPSGTWMSKERQARSTRVVPFAGAPLFEHPARYGDPRLPQSHVQFCALFEHQKRPSNALPAFLAIISKRCGIGCDLQLIWWQGLIHSATLTLPCFRQPPY